MCRVKAIVETFNSVTERKNSSLCAEHAAACQRERERERESISSGGLWNIYRDPPSISSAGVKKFSLVGMLLNATMQAQQIKSAKHKENYK